MFVSVKKFDRAVICWVFYFIQKNDSIGMSKRSYMEAVLEGLRTITVVDVDFVPHGMNVSIPVTNMNVDNTFNGTSKKKIYVRLLLSIDRRESTEAALETVCSENLVCDF